MNETTMDEVWSLARRSDRTGINGSKTGAYRWVVPLTTPANASSVQACAISRRCCFVFRSFVSAASLVHSRRAHSQYCLVAPIVEFLLAPQHSIPRARECSESNNWRLIAYESKLQNCNWLQRPTLDCKRRDNDTRTDEVLVLVVGILRLRRLCLVSAPFWTMAEREQRADRRLALKDNE
jgi:hypothetical protein